MSKGTTSFDPWLRCNITHPHRAGSLESEVTTSNSVPPEHHSPRLQPDVWEDPVDLGANLEIEQNSLGKGQYTPSDVDLDFIMPETTTTVPQLPSSTSSDSWSPVSDANTHLNSRPDWSWPNTQLDAVHAVADEALLYAPVNKAPDIAFGASDEGLDEIIKFGLDSRPPRLDQLQVKVPTPGSSNLSQHLNYVCDLVRLSQLPSQFTRSYDVPFLQ